VPIDPKRSALIVIINTLIHRADNNDHDQGI
jgi:hypothetical protein